MDAKLVVIGGKANMGEVKLRLPMTIGRGSKADLIISHPTVSREHCKLSEVNGELLVVDNGSSNGTFVDGDKIDGPTIVRSGQILAIGPLTFRAEYEVQQATKKRKSPQPHESGLAETQAVDRSEFDIDFILDDAPAPTVDKTTPAPKKKPAAPTVEAKAPSTGKPDAKKQPAAKDAAAPAKNAPTGKAPAKPKGPETEEMDLDFLLDDVAAEKKKAPAGRDTDQMDLDDLDLGVETPNSSHGDDLTSDFKSSTVEKTVSFTADELDLGDDFFAEPKTEEAFAEKPAVKEPAAKAPAAPEAKAPKVEPRASKEPAPKEPVAKEPPAAKPKKAGAMDFDFLSAGPSVEAEPTKKEVSFGDIAADFDFSGKAEAKKPASFIPPVVEEPAAEAAAVAPAPAEPEAISFDDASPAEEVVAEEPAAPPAAKDDQKLFDDFLDDLTAETPSAAAPTDEATAESAPFEAREEELVWDESPSPEELSLDDQLVEETLAKPEAAAKPEAPAKPEAAAPAEAEEFPFSEPVAPPRASELPAMPELAEAEAQPVAEVKPSEEFDFEEAPFHEAADAAAVAPTLPADSFDFEAPPAEVPMFDSASESMTLDDAIAAETKSAPTSESTPTTGDLNDIALDLDEVPAAPAPAVDLSAMNETQDIALGAPAGDDVTVAFTSAPAKASADEFDFLGGDQPAAAAEPPAASDTAEPNPFADFAPAASNTAPVFGEPEVAAPPANEFAIGPTAAPSITPAPSASKPASAAKSAAKLSLFDKIKMLFSGGAKAKPSKAKKSAAPAESPIAKRPIGAPRTAQSLDPIPLDSIPLDDGPIALSPMSVPPADAAPTSTDEMPSFDFDAPAIDVGSPSWAAPTSSSIAEAGSGFPVADSGWKSNEAPIPLDDAPLSFDFDAPAAPAADTTAAASASPAAPALEAPLHTEAAAEATAKHDEFDLFGDELLDASANPEAAAAQALADESAASALAATTPAATEPVAAEPAIDEPTPIAEQPAAEQPIAEEAFWLDDIATDSAAKPAVDAAPISETPWSDEPTTVASPEAITTPEAVSTDQPQADDEFPSFDLESSPEPSAATSEPDPAPLGLADDFSLTESAPTAEASADEAPVAEAPAAEKPFDFESTLNFAPDAEAPAAETPVSEAPAAKSDAWSLDEPEVASTSTDSASTDSATAGSATAEASAAPAPLPTPPVSSRARSIDVDLRLGSSLRPLTRVAMRPPKIDVAAMEPEAPSGRSFEPRPKAAAVPTPAPAAEAPTAETPAFEAPSSEAATSSSGDLDLDFGAYDSPAEAAQFEAASAESAFTEPAPAPADDLSFLTDAPATPAAQNTGDAQTPDDNTPDAADRTVAYRGTPKVVEEAESFLADLDDQARTDPEPNFDLDAMLADADRAQPPEAAPPAAQDAAADAGDELSFLTLTDDVAEAAPSAAPTAPEAKADEPAAHVPSAEVDLGFLDLVDVTEAPSDFQDFGFDDPKSETKKPVEPKADSAKSDGISEGSKNGAKSSPQPAAAAPKGGDEDLDDFLRDLGMN
jgi:hypothetical protein